jgi:hypothetical protein
MDASDLATLPLFGELSGEQLDRVAPACEELNRGGYRPPPRGRLRPRGVRDSVRYRRSGSRRCGDQHARARGLLGEIAVLSRGRRSASVVATSPLGLVTIFNRDIWRLEREEPEVASVLRSTIAARVGDGG